MRPIPAGDRDMRYLWSKIFTNLSVRYFREVYELLDFPFEPSDELQSLAKDSTLTYFYTFLNGEDYRKAISRVREEETPSLDLLKGSEADDPYDKKMEIFFDNTFSHLEQICDAEAIYNWVNQSYGKFSHRNRDALRAWQILLKEWAIPRWHYHTRLPPCEEHAHNWQHLLDRWLRIYPDPNELTDELNLPPQTQKALQCLVLYYETKWLQFEEKQTAIKASQHSLWEKFAFYVGTALTSISLEGSFRISLNEWKAVSALLDESEMQILEARALQYSRPHSWVDDLIVPFPIPQPSK